MLFLLLCRSTLIPRAVRIIRTIIRMIITLTLIVIMIIVIIAIMNTIR